MKNRIGPAINSFFSCNWSVKVDKIEYKMKYDSPPVIVGLSFLNLDKQTIFE